MNQSRLRLLVRGRELFNYFMLRVYMKSNRVIPLYILIAMLLSVAARGGTVNFAENIADTAVNQAGYLLDNGKIYREEKSLQEVQVEGNTIGITSVDDTLCYIRESDNGWIAGIYEYPDKESMEFLIGPGFSGLLKLLCDGNIFYFLADYASEGELNNTGATSVRTERVLVRFDPESGEKKIISGVEDFSLAEGRLVLLTDSGLDCNGTVIPVTLKGERYVERIVNGRFVFLTNGEEIEVIDVLSERNIYIYREGKAFPYSTDYNVILEFNDTAVAGNNEMGNDNMVYYQVSINGVESGRTETALSNVSKSSMIKTDTGKYCVIRAERWELDKTKGRYVRVNNVYQPEEVRLFVPENRIIKIRFDFNGERYTLNQSVYEN